MSLNLATIAYMRKYVDKAVSTGGVSAGGEWSPDKFYKKNTIITKGEKIYIAIQDVPEGTLLENGEYWSIFLDVESMVSGSDKTYRFQQTTPSKEWVISHNLNKYPSVVITDALGNLIIGDVQYIDLNSLKINLTIPTNGWANLN